MERPEKYHGCSAQGKPTTAVLPFGGGGTSAWGGMTKLHVAVEPVRERARHRVRLSVAHMASATPSDANQHGIQTYYRAKIAELEVQVREKAQNFRRLEAQRNEINAKGMAAFG